MIKDIIKTDNVIRCTIGLESIGEVRVLWEDGVVFFCAKDVCRAFNIQDYRTCVNKYCKKVQRFYHMTDVGIRKMNFVNFTDTMRIFEHSNLSDAVDLLLEYATIVDAFNQAYAIYHFKFKNGKKTNTPVSEPDADDDFDGGYEEEYEIEEETETEE